MNDVFKALSDSTRRDILLMLAEKPTNVNDIVDRFDMSRPAVSRHLKVLRQSNLISMQTDEADGRQVNCYAQLEAMQEVERYIKQLEQFWKAGLQGLGDYLDKQRKG